MNPINNKLKATVGIGAIVALVITVASWLDPGLGGLLSGSEAHIVGFVTLVQAVIGYYTKSNQISP